MLGRGYWRNEKLQAFYMRHRCSILIMSLICLTPRTVPHFSSQYKPIMPMPIHCIIPVYLMTIDSAYLIFPEY